MELIIPMGLMLLFLVLGMPVAFALGASGAVGLVMTGSFDTMMGILATSPYRSSASFMFTTLPMFILMAEFVSRSNLSTELFKAAYKWVGHLPGGMAVATIISCAGIGAMSGSTGASTAAMAPIAVPEMTKVGYKRSMALGCVATAGPLAIMIPPSVPFVLYGITTEVSVGKLLIAGILPGILLTLLLSIGVVILVKLNPSIAPQVKPFSWKERFQSLKGLWGVIILVLIVIGGLYSGFATPTEVAAIGATGAMLLALFSRRIDAKGIFVALQRTIKTTAMIFMLMIGAMIFGYYMTITQAPQKFVQLIASLPFDPWVIVMLFVLMYLLLGMFMDQLAILLLTVPLTFPVMVGLGYDPIWFGVVFICLTEIGLITPPMGMNCFVTSSASGAPVEEVFKGVSPYLISMVVGLTIIMIFPQISLLLPSLMK